MVTWPHGRERHLNLDMAPFPLSSSSHSFGRSRFIIIIIITIHLARPLAPQPQMQVREMSRALIRITSAGHGPAASDPESERAGGPEQARRRCQPHRCQCHLAPSRRPPSLPHTLIRSGNVRGASGGENNELTLGQFREDVKCSNQTPIRIFTVGSKRDHIARRQSGA